MRASLRLLLSALLAATASRADVVRLHGAASVVDNVVAPLKADVVVHPANPVKALSWEQLKDIHTGKVSNWKDVGGNDQPIAVYTDAAASATRGLVQQAVLSGAPYAPSAKAVAAVKEVAEEVARDERGIGALGREFVQAGQVAVVETRKLERPLGFITIGEPRPDVRRVIDAYRAASGARQ